MFGSFPPAATVWHINVWTRGVGPTRVHATSRKQASNARGTRHFATPALNSASATPTTVLRAIAALWCANAKDLNSFKLSATFWRRHVVFFIMWCHRM